MIEHASFDELIVLMDDPRVRRTLRRISYEIAENNETPSKIHICGLNHRGFEIAKLLRQFIQEADKKCDDVVQIQSSHKYKIQKNNIPDLTGKHVILVDDVIFSGKSMLRSLGFLLKKGEPAKIEIAVLVDRGHRVYPIEPTYTGLHYPTKLKEHVQVKISEQKNNIRVVLNSDYGSHDSV
jgi:pyrimidine operon attenuation protein/uracil phosphoribosyltransferase